MVLLTKTTFYHLENSANIAAKSWNLIQAQ